MFLGWALIGFFAALVYLTIPRGSQEIQIPWWALGSRREYADYRPVYQGLGNLALVLAGGYYLGIFHLMYSSLGVVTGPGWTDVHVRLPAYIVLAVLSALAGVALYIPAVGRWLYRRMTRNRRPFAWIGAGGLALRSFGGRFCSWRCRGFPSWSSG